MLRAVTKHITIAIVLYLNSVAIFANNQKLYNTFSNIATDCPMQVNCFATDKFGQLWYGTQNGLYAFDGYTSKQCTSFNGEIYSLCFSENTLMAGTDNGLLIVDTENGTQSNIGAEMGTVRSIKIINNTCFIGSQNGLFCLSNNQPILIKPQNGQLPNQTIYAIENVADTLIFIGTYNGLCSYSLSTKTIHTISLPTNTRKPNCFVNSLLWDNQKQTLAVGTEGELFTLTLQNKITRHPMLSGNSIKSLCLDMHNNLLIGTDYGLYTIDNSNNIKHIIHDVRNTTSIAGNNIWTIYTTPDGNVWIGTDNGISFSTLRNFFINISDITHTTQGNTITTILGDKQGNIWLGGTNGLIQTNKALTNAIWFSQSDSSHLIPHNHVRKLYTDTDDDLWVATDGGLLLYDYDKQTFIAYNLVDSTHIYNANWVYDVSLSTNNQLWIATCKGGLMVVDKQKLIAQTNQKQIACTVDHVYTQANGLSSDYVEHIMQNTDSGIVVMMHDGTTYRISNNNISKLPQHNLQPHSTIASYTDSTNIYIGGTDGIFCATHTEMAALRNNYETRISDIIVNNYSISEIADIRLKENIEIPENNKDITIVISNYNYSDPHNIYFAYCIEGLDNQWHTLPKGNNQLHLANLTHGTYTIHVGVAIDNNIDASPHTLKLTILPPWYSTWWAMMLYIIGLIAIIATILYILHIRHNIKQERQERNTSLEQAHIKLNFFAQISADLKGPLSQIIGELNTMLNKTTETELRTNIASILTNARQLNHMVGKAFFTSDDAIDNHIYQQEQNEPIKVVTETQDERFMAQVMSIIDANIDNPDFNVNALANKVCVSPKQLYRKIKLITNQTPIEYISGIRMKKAALLLSQGSFTVAEVMYMVGYTNHSYFAKCFSAAYGIPPKMYAQQQKDNN